MLWFFQVDLENTYTGRFTFIIILQPIQLHLWNKKLCVTIHLQSWYVFVKGEAIQRYKLYHQSCIIGLKVSTNPRNIDSFREAFLQITQGQEFVHTSLCCLKFLNSVLQCDHLCFARKISYCFVSWRAVCSLKLFRSSNI